MNKFLKRSSYALAALGLSAVAGSTNFLPAYATDATANASFSDGIGNISTAEITYDEENDITHIDATIIVDDSSIETILNQKSGKGSYPGSFYATVNPGYNLYTSGGSKIYKSYIYGDYETQDEIDAALAEDDEEYLTAEWWESSSNPFWPEILNVEYPTTCFDGTWVPAYLILDEDECAYSYYRVNNSTYPQVTIRQRLLDALGLTDASDLVYGENWRISAPSYTVSWVYTDMFDETAEGSARWHVDGAQTEYVTFSADVEYAFAYSGTNDYETYVRYESLEDALAGDETYVVVSDSVIEDLEFPDGFAPLRLANDNFLVVDLSSIDVSSDAEDFLSEDSDREALAEFTTEKIVEILDTQTIDYRYAIDLDALADVLSSGSDLVVSYNQYSYQSDANSGEASLDDLADYLEFIELTDPESYAEIDDFLNGKTLAGGFNGEIAVNGGYVGYIHELDDALTLTYGIPEDLLEPEDGYIRTFSVLRIHYNEGTQEFEIDELDATVEDGILTTASDKFSTFVVAYADTEDETEDDSEDETTDDSEDSTTEETTENPDTFDRGITTFLAIGGVTTPVILAAAWILAKRNA